MGELYGLAQRECGEVRACGNPQRRCGSPVLWLREWSAVGQLSDSGSVCTHRSSPWCALHTPCPTRLPPTVNNRRCGWALRNTAVHRCCNRWLPCLFYLESQQCRGSPCAHRDGLDRAVLTTVAILSRTRACMCRGHDRSGTHAPADQAPTYGPIASSRRLRHMGSAHGRALGSQHASTRAGWSRSELTMLGNRRAGTRGGGGSSVRRCSWGWGSEATHRGRRWSTRS